MSKDDNVSVGRENVRSVTFGAAQPLVLISGPCVIESRDHCLSQAEAMAKILEEFPLQWIFKASYDKANRTSLGSFRGVGLDEGLEILSEIRREFNVPVITDVHEVSQVAPVSEVVDVLQIPAFLCRQTDLLAAAGASRKPVMIKKGQFLAPDDMKFAAEKATDAGASGVLLCERGSCFGYRELVVDFRSLQVMSELGYPVVFDATHSVQLMGGGGGVSSGNRQFVAGLARSAVALGVDGVFLECHATPEQSPSDGPNMLALKDLATLLRDLVAIDELELLTRK